MLTVWLARLDLPVRSIGAIREPYRTQLRGDHRAAARSFIEMGMAYDAALALVDTGDEEAMREALGLLDGLGAVATARLVRQRMRQAGVRSIPTGARVTTREHPLGLTRREREVLDLICHGRTNAQIAADLVISAKTVDHHVSAVLAKLGTPTRAQAAAEAQRLGLAGVSQK
jgi:DNA-binding NarL/FixJ family response regulator